MPLALDHSIGTPPIDVYDTNIYPWLTVTDLLTWSMYPISGYLFVYVYDKWNIKRLGIPLYVLCWAVIGTAFEAISARFGVFQYKGWSLPYSFLVYLPVQLLTVVWYRILMHVFNRARKV